MDTLAFAVSEMAKTVSVPVHDDAVDEGKEALRLKLSNQQGAFAQHPPPSIAGHRQRRPGAEDVTGAGRRRAACNRATGSR